MMARMAMRRKREAGFTLVEIMIAALILAMGVASVLGVIFVAINWAREARDYTTMASVAQSAAAYCSAHQVPAAGSTLLLPMDETVGIQRGFSSGNRDEYFATPYAIRVERGSYDPVSASFSSSAGEGSTKEGDFVVLRLQFFENTEDRDLPLAKREARIRGTFYIKQWWRKP